ncbi:23164_t:CDS:2 [Gigaspora margarita]|uniref:23164_t:CDS:1 n=1 Tax=Gigaspora margarita TaxID=4874 RepID=A0ABN7V0T2_GIGMA|nr:23164_t:CDS:2 [Gigaspora margarita]
MGQRRTVLEDESIYFDFKTTESSSLKKDNDMTSTTSNMHQHKMDMDKISNATVEGTKILHQLYSSVVTNKNQILTSMELVDSTAHWIDIKEPGDINTGKNSQIPKNKGTLLENIKTTEDAPQIPITKYSKINNTLEWLQEKYEYDKIPAYILELLDQPDPD